MGFKTKGKKDGLNGNYKPPKKDGVFGTSFLQSERSEQRQKAYKDGHASGEREKKRRTPGWHF